MGDTMSTAAGSKPKEDIRDELVVTAVKFLQNSKVVGSSIETKKSFLMNKGLTSAEIEAAFSRLGSVAMVPTSPQGLHQAPQMLLAQPSFSSRIRDLLNVLLLIGGFSYGVRYLWEKYVRPWLFGITTPTKSPQETLMETCNAILSSVDLLKKSMVSLESSLDRHSNKLDEVSQNMLETSFFDGSSMKDIKSEVQSVKGILLSSRAFPQNPSLTPTRIPSWQLEDDGPDLLAKTVDGTSGNGSSISEIEMINSDSNEHSGEENQ